MAWLEEAEQVARSDYEYVQYWHSENNCIVALLEEAEQVARSVCDAGLECRQLCSTLESGTGTSWFDWLIVQLSTICGAHVKLEYRPKSGFYVDMWPDLVTAPWQ